jgi:hypothetical protein
MSYLRVQANATVGTTAHGDVRTGGGHLCNSHVNR